MAYTESNIPQEQGKDRKLLHAILLLVGAMIWGLIYFLSLGADASTGVSCPATDGGSGDGDSTVDGVITINSNTTWDTTGYAALGDYWDCTGLDIHVTSSKTLTFDGDTANGYYPFLKADNVTVDAGSKISADGQGCNTSGNLGGYSFGPTNLNVCTEGESGAPDYVSAVSGGASHGGRGGEGNISASNHSSSGVVYGSEVWPVLFGSSGASSATKHGGSGGGVIRMELSDTLALEGEITADGTAGAAQGTATMSGPGAGGSILIVADTVSGTAGTITTSGYQGLRSSARRSGGAGGGRVAVHANTSSGVFSSFTASTVAAGGIGATSGTLSEGGNDGTYQLNPDTTPSILRVQSFDNSSSNSQIDEIEITFNQNMDSSTLATSDFTISDGRSVTAVSVEGQVVTLTVAESGVSDLDESLTLSIAGSISGESGGSVSSGTENILAPSCLYVDGSSDDDDKEKDGTFTVDRRTKTWTPTSSLAFVCPGQSIHVTESSELIFGSDRDNGYYVSYEGADVTIDSGSTIQSDEQGCNYDSASSGDGSGPGVNNTCAYTEDGGGEGIVGGQIGGGGGSYGGQGGDGAAGATVYSAGDTYGSETNPLAFGASGGSVLSSSLGWGGFGGGIVAMTLSGTFTLDGAISANGGDGVIYSGNARSGGGSGGSINIQTETLESSSNTCDISVNGGDAQGDGSEDAGAGGGGRVAFRVGTVDAGMTCYSSLAASDVAQGGAGPTSDHDGVDGTLSKAGISTVPDTPTNSSPSDAATSVSRTPTLTSSAYSGSDSHSTSTWEVDNNSDFSSPEWTATDDATNLVSIVVNDTNGVFANDLDGFTRLDSDTYYFRVLHSNVAGDSSYSSSTSFTTQHSAPTVASLAAAQLTDGSGTVDLSFDLDDADDDEFVKAKIELSTDGGSTWDDPTLTAAAGPPSVTNASPYQVENVDTSGGAVTINTSFESSNFTDFDGSIQYRVTPNDGTEDGTVQTSGSITVDAVAPTEAADFATDTVNLTSVDLTWTASTETNLDTYQIYYGTNQTQVEAQSGGSVVLWDDEDDADLGTLATTTTTVTGLSAATTYYAVICALDDFGYQTCGSSAISFLTVNAPVLSSYAALQTSDASGDVTLAFTVDDEDGGTVDVKVEYSTDGVTWSDPTLSGNAAVDNAEVYQIQNIDVDGGASSETVTWDAATDLAGTTDDDTVYVRVTATDGENVGASIGSDTAFTVDLVAPVAASSLTEVDTTSATVEFSWTPGAESHFSEYIIWYGDDQSDVEAQTSDSWTSSDQANLTTRTTSSADIDSLSEATTYYFVVCAHDDYGYETCSSTFNATTGSKPSVSSITIAQKTDGSGDVDVSAVFTDVDGDDLRAKIELSLDGGSTWSAVTLSTTDSDTTASAGDPGVNNATTYKLGKSGEYIDTSGGANTVAFDLVASNFTDTDIANAQIRITPNDIGSDGTVVVSDSFVVDTVDPTVPANFEYAGGIPGVMFLDWELTTESNFDHYEIWYGTNQTKVDDRDGAGGGAATEFDDDPDDSDLAKLGTNSVVINGLTPSTTYYAMLCAVDEYGNEACTDSITVTENVISSVLSTTTSQTASQRSNGYLNVCAEKIVDSDNPTQMQLGVDYSTDAGATFNMMTVVSGSITADVGSTPGLATSGNYQIGKAGSYIDMSTGENTVCFNWNYRSDLGTSLSEDVEFRFRPYDGTNVGTPPRPPRNPGGSGIKPPKAFFTATCDALSCDFDASGSVARAGSISSYSWYFGGGYTGTGETPSVTYDDAQVYWVTLQVANSYGKTDSYTRPVEPQSSGGGVDRNAPPVAEFTATCTDLECDFTDESTDSDGTLASYSWNFGGDGTSTSSDPTHTFSDEGVYTVYLTVTDDDGDTDRTRIPVTVTLTEVDDTPPTKYAPTAVIAEPSCTNLACSFDGTGSSDSDGSIDSYTWFFGDLSADSGSTTSHTYSADGTYKVRLYVTDDDDLEGMAEYSITVADGEALVIPNLAPTAVIAEPTCEGLECTFDGTGSSDSDGSIASYIWSFGDGNTDSVSGSTATHTYSRGGSYNVTLKVVDDDAANGYDLVKVDPIEFDSSGGVKLSLDEIAPTDLSSITSTANTSATLTMDWTEVTEQNFYRYEIWVGTDATKVNNRDISAPNGAVRWDEGYDSDMLDQDDANSIVSGLSENTTYYLKIWAKDSYGNESTLDAVSYKTNDRPDVADGAEEKATDGTGYLTFTADYDDYDDSETISGQYYYNNGLGWEPMTLITVDATTGEPVVSSNEVGGAEGYISVAGGANEVAVVWDSKTDLPDADVTDLRIRVIPNDSIENGDALVLSDVVLDNVAPSGLDGGSASFVSASRPFLSRLTQPFLARETATVTVSWDPVSAESSWSGDAAYWVTYGTTSGSLTSTWDSDDDSDLTTMSTSSTNITGLDTNTTYYFQVHAKDAYGNTANTAEFSVSTTTGGSGGSGGSGSGGSLTGNIGGGQNFADAFEFDYELPEHWSADYIDELIQDKAVWKQLQKDDRVMEFVLELLEDPDQVITREQSVLLLSMVTNKFNLKSFIPEDPNHFPDLSDRNEFYQLILWHQEKGRVDGHGDGKFRSKGSTARVEALKLIAEFMSIEIADPSGNYLSTLERFADVAQGQWYGKYLDYALQNSVVRGYDDGTFQPAKAVTMAELLKMTMLMNELVD